MSDIKKFLLRLPDDLYAALEAETVMLNTSMNKLIVERLRDGKGTVLTYQKAAVRTIVAATLPNTKAGCDVPDPSAAKAKCPRDANHFVFRRGDGVWCSQCARLY